jgi:hypothetical protein
MTPKQRARKALERVSVLSGGKACRCDLCVDRMIE